MHRTSLLILQATPFCNLDCTYCYLPGRDQKGQISLDVVSATMENLQASGLLRESLSVVWHAGEPLVLPASFFAGALERVLRFASDKCKIDNYIQTNATLVTAEHCEVLRKHGAKVGVSLDGPAFLHDRGRRTRKGRETHASAVAGTRMLQAHGLPVSAIAVVSSETLKHPDEFYYFFAELGIRRVGFNVEEIEGPNKSSSLLQANDQDDAFKSFVRRLLHLSLEDGRVAFREFALLMGVVSQEMWLDGNSQVAPASMVNVAMNGDFTFFSPEMIGIKDAKFGNFILGNVLRDSIAESLHGAAFERLAAPISAGVTACQRECEYFPVCGGGAPSNKYFENGDFGSTETRYCYFSKKLLTSAVLEYCEQDLPAFLNRQSVSA